MEETTNKHERTPEQALWTAVLGTFTTDAVLCKYNPETLMKEAHSQIVRNICDLIDLDHGFFCAGLHKLINKSQKKGYKWLCDK